MIGAHDFDYDAPRESIAPMDASRPQKTTIINTRPAPDDVAFSELCRARGFEPIECPVLTIHFKEMPGYDISRAGALAFTSANGVRAFVKAFPSRNTQVLCVGEATALEAGVGGFKEIFKAGGNVESLASLATDLHRQGQLKSPVLHIAGTVRRGNLANALACNGIDCETLALYEARPVATLTDAALTAIQQAEAQIMVALFSPRSARLFLDQMAKYNPTLLERITPICLSDQVADALPASLRSRGGIAITQSADALLDAAQSLIRREHP